MEVVGQFKVLVDQFKVLVDRFKVLLDRFKVLAGIEVGEEARDRGTASEMLASPQTTPASPSPPPLPPQSPGCTKMGCL